MTQRFLTGSVLWMNSKMLYGPGTYYLGRLSCSDSMYL